MSELKVIPFKGYSMDSKEISFGMNGEQIEELDGIAYKIVIDNIMQEKYEYRISSIKLTYMEDRFESVIIPEQPGDNVVYIDGIPMCLFEKQCMEYLKENYQYVESKNKMFINFMDLGIILWGCGQKKSKEGKFVWAYSEAQRGYYENMVYC